MGFAPTPGGSVAAFYNQQGVATGAQFYDAEGHLIGHIVSTADISRQSMQTAGFGGRWYRGRSRASREIFLRTPLFLRGKFSKGHVVSSRILDSDFC